MGSVNFNTIVVTFRNEIEKLKGKKIKDEKYFYDQQVKYFNDILKTLDIWNERRYMKKEYDDLKEYSFDSSDVDFVKQLLFDYTKKEFQDMRKNNFYKVPFTYLEQVIYGFKNILLHNKAPEHVINNAIMKMYDRTNYPLKRHIESFKKPLEKLIGCADGLFYSNAYQYQTRQDKIEWLVMMEKEIHKLIEKWEDIYKRVDEIRNDEINNLAIEESFNMTMEEEIDSILEMNVTVDIHSFLENNKEYQQLCEEKESLIRDDGFVQSKVKRFDEISARIFEIYDEAQRKLYSGKVLVDFRKKRNTCEFAAMKPSKKVLKEAIKEYEDDIKLRNNWEEQRKLEIDKLKEFNLEKMISNTKNKSSQEN